MGRYKSVLMAERDARDFPHHVELPIPPFGLGKRLDGKLVIVTGASAGIGKESAKATLLALLIAARHHAARENLLLYNNI